jgi:hypothetical protein
MHNSFRMKSSRGKYNLEALILSYICEDVGEYE